MITSSDNYPCITIVNVQGEIVIYNRYFSPSELQLIIGKILVTREPGYSIIPSKDHHKSRGFSHGISATLIM